MKVNIKGLTDSRDTVNKWMERFGVRFGVYKKGTFKEQLFPFDSVPRIIPKKDWDYLEAGLQQREGPQYVFVGYLSRQENYQGWHRARGIRLFL